MNVEDMSNTKKKPFDRVYMPDSATCEMIDFLADVYDVSTRSKLVSFVVMSYEGIKKENQEKAKEIRALKLRIAVLEKEYCTKNSQKSGSLFS